MTSELCPIIFPRNCSVQCLFTARTVYEETVRCIVFSVCKQVVFHMDESNEADPTQGNSRKELELNPRSLILASFSKTDYALNRFSLHHSGICIISTPLMRISSPEALTALLTRSRLRER